MKNKNIHIFSSIEKLADFFAGRISEEIIKINGERPFSIALSGGSTPKEIFRFLVKNHRDTINWSQVLIFWGDERCVDPASDESNYKMVYESLIRNIAIPPGNIYRIKGENSAAQEAERYAGIVNDLLPHRMNLPQFDLFLLGLGEDGHTASIFPGQIGLFHSEKLFEVSVHPTTSQKRITATGKLINNSRNIWFLVTGDNKAARVAQIIGNEPEWQDLPASLVNPVEGNLDWMLDVNAAQKLSERSGSFRG